MLECSGGSQKVVFGSKEQYKPHETQQEIKVSIWVFPKVTPTVLNQLTSLGLSFLVC